MKYQYYYHQNNYGFTLIELLMVICIIAILGFNITQRYSIADISQETAANQIEAYIRYCQAKAISQYMDVDVSFSSDSKGYYFTINGQNYYIPSSLSLSYMNPGNIITFDSIGEAVSSGTITITGDDTVSITVEPTTGRVKRL